MVQWQRDDGKGTRSGAWNRFQLSVGRTSHRIWVAFRALKSSGVSSSTVSPLPFTPSSRSFLYSFYRTEEDRRLQRRTHEQAGPKQRQKTVPSASIAAPSFSSKSPSLQTTKNILQVILINSSLILNISVIPEKQICCLIIQFFFLFVIKFTLF